MSTTYTAWPSLEAVARHFGFSGLPLEFFMMAKERAVTEGTNEYHEIENMARKAGQTHVSVAAGEYRDFLNGMRQLLRRK